MLIKMMEFLIIQVIHWQQVVKMALLEYGIKIINWNTKLTWNQEYNHLISMLIMEWYNTYSMKLIVATDNEECKILKGAHVVHKLDIS
jgi:hypothetical protein